MKSTTDFQLIPKVPDLSDGILSSVDQPLTTATDKVTGQEYILSDYNRDGDSYRSVDHLLKCSNMYLLYHLELDVFNEYCDPEEKSPKSSLFLDIISDLPGAIPMSQKTRMESYLPMN